MILKEHDCPFSQSKRKLHQKTSKKKAYQEQLKARVTALPTMPRSRPPLLMKLGEKLLRFLNTMRARGGVINSHVVRATADALIRSNHLPGLQHLRDFWLIDSISLQAYGLHQKNGNNSWTACSKGIIIWWMQSFLPSWYVHVDNHKEEVQHSTTAHPEYRSITFFLRLFRKVNYSEMLREICIDFI